MFAQGLAAAVRNKPELNLEPILMLNPGQIILDADVSCIDVAVIDVRNMHSTDKETGCSVCKLLRQALPDCRVLLLVSQDHTFERHMAIEAIRSGMVDDFVFHDTSLDYLLAKLSAL